MPFSLPHTQVSRQIMLLLVILLAVVLSTVTLGAAGASHDIFLSPICGTHASLSPGSRSVT